MFSFFFQKSIPQSIMLWSNETNAGFNNGSGSLNIDANFESINVQVSISISVIYCDNYYCIVISVKLILNKILISNYLFFRIQSLLLPPFI